MSNEEVIKRSENILKEAQSLEFSENNLIELGALTLRTQDIYSNLNEGPVREKCLYELHEFWTDERKDLFENKDLGTLETEFKSAKYEFIAVLEDCIGFVKWGIK
jgi:hypothetical protein